MRLILPLLAALLALPAAAQPMGTADVVTWRVRADRAAPGASARLVLDAQIADGWQLYAVGSPVGIPLEVTLGPLPAGVTAGRVAQSTPRTGYDPAFERDYAYHTEAARVVQRVRVAPGTPAGTRQVTGSVRYAVCNDEVCLPPAQTRFRVPLVVE